MALIKPRRDRRALGYATLAIGFVAIALLRGEPRDLALAAPFAALLIVGLRSVSPIEVTGRIRYDTVTAIEGDEIHGTIDVVRPRGTITTIAVDNRAGWTPLDPEPVLIWTVAQGGDRIIAPFTLRAETWGRHRLGAINLSLRRPLGVTVWEYVTDEAPSFNVLPTPEHLRRLLPAPASQSSAGVHISRFVADGFDFAELRPFALGDRLRDVNWRASARSDELQTNRRHPDRSGEVVLLLDTFADGIGAASVAAQAALTRAARAAWSVAQLHLGVQDRVGLAAQGRVVTQLRPRSGDRARYDLLSTLLSIGGLVAAGESAHGRQPLSRLPPNSLILAFTPLIDQRFTTDLLALHRAGRPVMAVQIVLDDLIPPPVDDPEVLARRIFALGLDAAHDDLVRAGIPLVRWTGESDLGSIVAGLERLHRRVVA